MNDRSVLLRRAVVGALVLATAPAFGQQTTQTDENTTRTVAWTAVLCAVSAGCGTASATRNVVPTGTFIVLSMPMPPSETSHTQPETIS